MAGNEVQYGGSLTVRDSQVAVFVNEGTIADFFGPGMHKLAMQTLPVLTYLKRWDKLFQSPFKSGVQCFSTRQQIDRRWGTTQPVTIRDKDFGAVRLRAFGNCAYAVADAKLFHTNISGTRDRYSVEDLDRQLRGLMLQHISDAVAVGWWATRWAWARAWRWGIFWLCFVLIDKLTPYDLWAGIIEKKNVALAIVVGSMCIAIGRIVSAAVQGQV